MRTESTTVPYQTPSQEAFEAVLREIPNLSQRRAIYGDEPHVVISGPQGSLEQVMKVAEGAGLYPQFSTGMTSISVHGFSEDRPRWNKPASPLFRMAADICHGQAIASRLDPRDPYTLEDAADDYIADGDLELAHLYREEN